jgi:hypothetical protein
MWKRFWIELSKAMLMMDPMAFGLYLASNREAAASAGR